MPPRPPPALHLPPEDLEGVTEDTWLDVIHKMEEVYSKLVTDEVELEEKNAQLEQSQQFIFSLLSSMSDVLIACNQDGLIEESNAALCELVGRSEQDLLGTPVPDLLADAQSVQRWQLAMYHAAAHEVAVVELNLRDAQGLPVPVDMSCTPRHNSTGRQVGRVLVGRPLGELKRAYHQLREAHDALKLAQQQLLHSEKMASLGRLVAGVAHELNNPISFVLGNVHVLQRYGTRLGRYLEAVHQLDLPAPIQALRQELRIDTLVNDLPSLMEGTLEGAQRTADIVDGLKRFSSASQGKITPVELNAVVERAIHWVQKGTAPNFEIQWTRGPDCHVSGNAGQLLQVMMNLIQNAADAANANTSAGAAAPQLRISLTQQDRQVQLRFSDNGPGIAAAHLSRIFDPFFTTKSIGKGTGLGLSISYGLVQQHGGHLTCANLPEGGAEFTLVLPMASLV
ncbi:MAG: PAS domain-containing sensor histidine kinase [Burkholderiales bacterium RIFOXYC2_FULL_59_8]|nr:MAG: PAS domain-containing sensor histidine kinase [Burkholderiales bacterium RIFOXYC2_FULL_59_8]OGB58109.1 MAG: PAS domain-containing sensor histidine kinase [Burkholderiales bacterium RIFOXYD12_FULL_59_19]